MAVVQYNCDSFYYMLNNIAIWAHWRLQAKKDVESNTDPIDSVQLNLKATTCIFEYGNQSYKNSTCCYKSIVIL